MLKVQIYDETIVIGGDFSAAASAITLDGEPTGYQVADFRHSLRDAAAQIIRDAFHGEVDEAEVLDAIDRALEARDEEEEEHD